MEKRHCEVCHKEPFRYTCPRCSIVYCSLACYKVHGSECTDRFYQSQVEDQLKGQRVTPEERRRFEKVLWKLHRLDMEDGDQDEHAEGEGEEAAPDDAEGEVDIAGGEEAFNEADERYEELREKAERGELSLADLTPEEQQQFRSALKRGDLHQFIDPYAPWWNQCVLDESGPVPPHVCCGANRKASDLVAHTLISILYGYAHVMRRCEGQWAESPTAWAAQLLAMALWLSSSEQPPASLVACLDRLIQTPTEAPVRVVDRQFNLNCMADVASLLATRDRAGRAIRECAELIESLTPKGTKSKRWLFGVSKKLDFVASFAHHHFNVVEKLVPKLDVWCQDRQQRLDSERQAAEAIPLTTHTLTATPPPSSLTPSTPLIKGLPAEPDRLSHIKSPATLTGEAEKGAAVSVRGMLRSKGQDTTTEGERGRRGVLIEEVGEGAGGGEEPPADLETLD